MKTSLVGAVESSMSGSEHTSSEQRNLGAAIHRPLNELEPAHLTFDLPVTPEKEDYHGYRVAIPVKADAK